MKELSAPSSVDIPWTFRATTMFHQNSEGRRLFNALKRPLPVGMVSETTVSKRFFFDARKEAAQILGVERESLVLIR